MFSCFLLTQLSALMFMHIARLRIQTLEYKLNTWIHWNWNTLDTLEYKLKICVKQLLSNFEPGKSLKYKQL